MEMGKHKSQGLLQPVLVQGIDLGSTANGLVRLSTKTNGFSGKQRDDAYLFCYSLTDNFLKGIHA